MVDTWRSRLTLPAYQTKDAARFAGISPQTISGWFYGYPKSEGERGKRVFPKGKRQRAPLSYLQLVEVAFVATCRVNGMSLKAVRRTREYLARAFQVEYPFADLRLGTMGPHVIADADPPHADLLVIADAGGQMAWRAFMADRIDQFDYEGLLASRWFPRGRATPIFIDPRMNFGKPMLARSGVATWVVADAILADEDEDEIMLDYGVDREEIAVVRRFELPRVA